jgi:hypothetical protein
MLSVTHVVFRLRNVHKCEAQIQVCFYKRDAVAGLFQPLGSVLSETG